MSGLTITISWHWWMAPLLVLLAGWLWAAIEAKNSQPGGMFPDIGPPLIFISAIFAAVAMMIGHFL